MTSRGILGYISSGRNLKSLTSLKSLRLLLRIKQEKKIKVLRTDNGGELCGNEFEEFCKKCCIARQKNTPYTPQEWSCRKDEHDVDGKIKVHA
jgi:hypothetical protein